MEIPFPSESFIEDYVFNQIKTGNECPISGEHFDFAVRQPNFDAYGIGDILKVSFERRFSESFINITILELKNEPLKARHIVQLCRYMTFIKKAASRYERFLKNKKIIVKGELAGPLNTSDDFVFIANFLSADIDIYSLSASMENGFKAYHIGRGWSRTDSLHKNKPISKSILELIKHGSVDDFFDSTGDFDDEVPF